MQVKKQQLEPDKKQWTGSKLGKEYVKAVYCNLAYLTSMLSTSFRMLGWMNHKLESRFLGKILTTSDMQITLPPHSIPLGRPSAPAPRIQYGFFKYFE